MRRMVRQPFADLVEFEHAQGMPIHVWNCSNGVVAERPLTPALSLGEREQRIPPWLPIRGVGVANRGRGFRAQGTRYG